jgi:hypothetical protein
MTFSNENLQTILSVNVPMKVLNHYIIELMPNLAHTQIHISTRVLASDHHGGSDTSSFKFSQLCLGD